MHRLNDILKRIEELETELVTEVYRKQEELIYTIRKKKVLFSEEVKRQHKELASTLSEYVYDSGALIILTMPLIWSVVIPALVLDALASLYQVICFPIYGIPRVKRSEYVVIDRHELQYLNRLEKLNCVYCGYFNGLMGYLREIAARTEQYWCPIRHARPIKSVHSRYRRFFEYGDGEAYHDSLDKVRTEFDDLK